ncbi:HdeD family acid-resistance protein [Edaphobacter sp.]|uniref:HdeD family acid-resistance protein n=1 Tax=Edaphobacter sp. TaxID=1934404 RepID=UPI002DB88B1E|nr:HdeD family acid-resistance protein [Edaphobacter sp.]HEU5339919.1 HdeD family acid-resistance protein [Edaphobacter sp.]
MSSSPSPLAGIVYKSLGWSVALSILLILFGLIAIAAPGISGVGVTIFVGWLLIVSGVFHLIFAWKVHTTGRKVWEILLGIVYLIVGIDLTLHPLSGLLTLTLALAIYLLFESAFEFILAIRLHPAPGWGWTLFDGIITLLLAFMVWRTWPVSSVWAIGTLVGISMVFSGFSRLMLSLTTRRLISAAA